MSEKRKYCERAQNRLSGRTKPRARRPPDRRVFVASLAAEGDVHSCVYKKEHKKI